MANANGLRIFVGVTDKDWYTILKEENCEEVNFWRPSASGFKALQPNDMLLFKLHAPDNYIVGGGFFVRYTILPTFLAWSAFGIENGVRSLDELNKRIEKYRKRNGMTMQNPQIGCIILTEPFFFERDEWIPCPSDFKLNTVVGKRYSTDEANGLRLYNEVQDRLQGNHRPIIPGIVADGAARYGVSLTKHRLGQGAFRICVADAYQRRCAITGEKTLPVLEAAHIKPYAENGPHEVSNGMLLKSDFHTLYDGGYITIDTDYRVNVSKTLHEDFGNGRDYYKYDGEKLMILPEQRIELPSKEFLEWHNEHVYRG